MSLDVLIENQKIKSITTYPGEKIAFVGTTTGEATVGSTLGANAFVASRVGDAVIATTTFVAVDGDMKVLAVYEYEVATGDSEGDSEGDSTE